MKTMYNRVYLVWVSPSPKSPSTTSDTLMALCERLANKRRTYND